MVSVKAADAAAANAVGLEQEALKCLQAELHRCGGNAYLSPLASSIRWSYKFAALGKISTFVSKQTNAFRLVWDGRGPLATLLPEGNRAGGFDLHRLAPGVPDATGCNY